MGDAGKFSGVIGRYTVVGRIGSWATKVGGWTFTFF
jgi:hypothetical protein